MSTASVSDKRHRFPGELIAHAVWLYFRLPPSFFLTEEMLPARGIVVSHEAIHRWSLKSGVAFTYWNSVTGMAAWKPLLQAMLRTLKINVTALVNLPGNRLYGFMMSIVVQALILRSYGFIIHSALSIAEGHSS